MLGVRLPESLEKRLDALAVQTHRSKSYYVKRALTEFLEEQEDYLLATSQYEDFLKSGKKAIPLDEIKKKYGLDDA